jgi:hypothetical protein
VLLMDHILIVLAMIVVYFLFLLVKRDVACEKCSGWGHKAGKRRRIKACSKCKGTGRQFLPGAQLLSKGIAKTVKHMREKREAGR